MCSRYELTADPVAIAAHFGRGLLVPGQWGATIRPTDGAPVLAAAGWMARRWGLAVDWQSRPLINARLEGVDSRPTFRPLLRRRVLVPATAWWEWNAARLKMRMAPPDGGLLALAGLEDGDRFVILTRAASPGLATVHDRMPVLADAGWLDGGPLPTPPGDGAIIATPDQPPSRQPDLFG